MMLPDHRKQFLQLLRKYLSGQGSDTENRFLEEYYDAFEDREEFLASRSKTEKASLEAEMRQRIMEMAGLKRQTPGVPTPVGQTSAALTAVTPFYKRTWFAAAAAVLLLFSSAVTYLILSGRKQGDQAVAKAVKKTDNIMPGSNKAFLILADGSRIALEDAGNGELTKQGNTIIEKKEQGLIRYDHREGADKETVYNTITTPRGGSYCVVLPDGSKAWLNAASSLRFPTAFQGKQRRVAFTGEVYFEIASLVSHPFIASTGGTAVTVLGTSFNVKAYEDESTIRTTLLDGAVKVEGDSGSASAVVLKPGQQATIAGGAPIKVKEVDAEEQIAWKNGIFFFNKEQIGTVMKQLERWYDVDVSYKDKPSGHFTGMVSRNADVRVVLSKLELTGGVHFKIEGRKIIVSGAPAAEEN